MIPTRFIADEVATLSARERYDYSNDISGWTVGMTDDYEEKEEENDDLRDRFED